jgi:hypothetical protein
MRARIYYAGRCRSAAVAGWHANFECFVHGQRYLERIPAPEDEQTYDVFLVPGHIDPPEADVIPDDDIEQGAESRPGG